MKLQNHNGKAYVQGKGKSVSSVFHLLPHFHPHSVPELILHSLGVPWNHKPTAGEAETPPSGLLPGVMRQNMQLRSKCH